MGWHDLDRMAEDDNSRDREKWIGVYIGALAVLLAICSMGSGNASKDATLKNIEASNTWAFFQAKNVRRQVLRMQADDFEALIASTPSMPEAAKTAITAKVADYRHQDEILTKDPDKEPGQREGLDQLFDKGKALEAERDLAMSKDPYFDYGEACLQIAIVLASVAIISSGSMLIIFSGMLGALGVFLTFNGFALLFVVPWLG